MTDAKEDNAAIDCLATACKTKLAYKRSARGGSYSGWQDADERWLWEELCRHLMKKDPVDIANYCAMIHAKRNPFKAKP